MSLLTNQKRLAKRFASLHQKYVAPYLIISVDPLIIHIPIFPGQLKNLGNSYKILFEYLKNRRVYILCNWGGFAEKNEVVTNVKNFQNSSSQSYGDFRFFHLFNTEGQSQMFRTAGLQGIFCNHNAFVDEKIYCPLPDTEKTYDAVYDARLSVKKRHYLADGIEKLALIYYFLPSDEKAFADQVLEDFSHARHFNMSDAGSYERLSAEKVNESLNRCRVGLCLSEKEGAMYASVQYLLCGLPVVTTPSIGGRDVFFDNEYVITVEPNSDAVSEAVKEMISRDISPEYIRRRTITNLFPHRARFIDLIQSISDREGCKRNFKNEWGHLFFNRMLKNQNHLETIDMLEKFDR